MSELLAVIVYLLHVEQWPASCDGDRTSDAVDASPSECKRERLRTASAESLDELDAAEASFMYVEAFLGAQDDGAYLDRDALLRLTAFTGGSANYYECVLLTMFSSESDPVAECALCGPSGAAEMRPRRLCAS